ncbi:MAG: peptidoglycan-binding protein, partial [Nocardioidaceae bacterium]|nr:peptidoglycan-binding protein [Nocardioidaceae bacterium]
PAHPASTSPPAPTPAHPELTRYLDVRLAQGAHGRAVVALQRRLHITADGWFGPRTRDRVKLFQRRHHLPITGVVNTRTWRALGA